VKTWIKLHTEIIDDPKLGRLSFADKGLWLYLIALAGKLDHRDPNGNLTGQLGTLDDIAWLLRTTPDEIQPGIERMLNANMLHYDDNDILYVTHFAQRQANDTDAERARNYRASRSHHTTVTQPSRSRHAAVTQPSHDRHHIESESETESETETETDTEQNNSRTHTPRARNARARIAAVAAARSVSAAAAATNPPSPSWQRESGALGAPSPSSAHPSPPGRGAGGEGLHRAAGGEGNHPDPDNPIATTHTEITRATNALTNLGIEPTTTHRLVTTKPYAHIIGWTNYATNQPGLQNPAGYVIKMLNSGTPPPPEQRKTWFTPEEEQLYFGVKQPQTCPTCNND